MMEETKHLCELPITNNLVDLTSNGKFDDEPSEQKGVNVFCNGSVAELKENKQEESTTACSGNGAMHSQISSLNEKSRCELCDAEVTEARSLAVHMAVYHRQDQQTLLTQDLSSNLEGYHGIHVKNKPELSTDFKKSKNDANNLQIHQKILKEEMFTQISMLKHHKCIHSSEKPIKCTDSDKAISKWGADMSNQSIHTGEKHYKCKDCGEAFRQPGSLKRHQNIHKGFKPFECYTCGKAFKYSKYLQKHKRIHKEENEKLYLCTDCGKVFNSSSDLNCHQNIHKGPYKYIVCFEHSVSVKYL